jgi:hypothetical protein
MKAQSMTMIEAVVHYIAVCYPSESLSRQVAFWADNREDCRIAQIFSRKAMEIRRSLSGADLVLVDASADHAQAIELFSQSVAKFGSRGLAVYTERMHEGLELFVRTQGAWLLMGPLDDRQWEEFFASILPQSCHEPVGCQAGGEGLRRNLVSPHPMRCREIGRTITR